MTYSAPTPAPTNKPLYTAVIALVVIMAMTIAALGAIFVLGGTSEASSPAPAQAAATSPLGVVNTPLDKNDPAVAEAAQAEATPAEAAQAEAAAQPEAAEAQAVEPQAPAQTESAPTPVDTSTEADAAAAAPIQAAPAPQDFHPTCGTSKSHVEAGETFIISGTHTPHNVSVNWAFDHGDGFVDRRNPSHAYYQQAGTYTVIGLAESTSGQLKRVHCGTVTVTAPFTPEFHCTIDDTNIEVNGNTVFRATSNVEDHSVVYTFDHGDGYREVANPSYATYYGAGTYYVSVTAQYDGVATHVDCGTVTVSNPAPPTCPTISLLGMTEADAQAAIRAANCTPVTVARDLAVFPITADYVTDRVQLHVVLDIVVKANIG